MRTTSGPVGVREDHTEDWALFREPTSVRIGPPLALATGASSMKMRARATGSMPIQRSLLRRARVLVQYVRCDLDRCPGGSSDDETCGDDCARIRHPGRGHRP